MPEIPPVTGGDTIATSWGNPIAERVVSRYANATARDVAVPIPVAGDPAYLVDVDELQVYDGTGWREYLNIDSGGFVIVPRPNRLTGALQVLAAENASLTLSAGVGVNELLVVIGTSGIGPTPDPGGSQAVLLQSSCYIDASVGSNFPVLTFELFDLDTSTVIGTTKQTVNGTVKHAIMVQGYAPTEGAGFHFRVSRDDTSGVQIVQQTKMTQIWIDG